MVKLKCWRKLVNIKKDKILVFKKIDENGHHLDVYLQDYAGKNKKDWVVDLDTPSIGRTLKIAKTKIQALKFANKYMKKHDKC